MAPARAGRFGGGRTTSLFHGASRVAGGRALHSVGALQRAVAVEVKVTASRAHPIDKAVHRAPAATGLIAGGRTFGGGRPTSTDHARLGAAEELV